MAQPNFVHLHAHSEYSLLDGACRINGMVKRAADLGMPAIALTDHGVMYGAIHFYKQAREAGIKPIIGCEVYVARGSHKAREGRKGKEQNHLLLLAQNETGYKNLMKLVTAAHLDGFYYKPRVDRDLLHQHHEGLICLSGCLAGEVAQQVMEGQDKEALHTICEHQEIFGKENYYLELQDHDISEQQKLNQFLLQVSERYGAPLVATNDIHYLEQEDADPHDVLLCIQTGSNISDPNRMRFDTKEFYLKTQDEMLRRFREFPGSIERTLEIAERCNLELDFGRLQLPDLPIPEGRTEESHLRQIAWEGLERRYPNASQEIRDRMQYELDTIVQCGYEKYLLIVRDFALFAKNNKILAGVRGSAAGSIVCYCLGITGVDPIFHSLTFERFLNPERIQMPDVDFDFQDDRRDEVIRYVSDQYGHDHVAQIVTFGTLAARAAVRDAGRAMEYPLAEVDKIAKMIPTMPVGITIEKALTDSSELRAAYDGSETVRKLIDMARKLEGINRHASTHAAGVIVSKDPLIEHVPLQKAANGELITQYDMECLGEIGLLKMDFLGLINLSIIDRCLRFIKENKGIELALEDIPVDDQKTFNLLASAETTGLFQLESEGMRRNIRELKPQNISELAAMVALYRPGPMAHIPRYISNKFGRTKIEYLHPCLEPILKETYGIIVYQDQVLQILRAAAGFSLGQADVLRRAMGKKDSGKMAKERQNFIDGAAKNGIPKKVGEKLFDLIQPFAGYAFNKAHAVCYGTVAYQTAFLKANYPVEYMTALLACHAEHQDKVTLYVEEARRLGLEILPPDVNHSNAEFSIEKGSAIRFGLTAIKNCGRGFVDGITGERQSGGEFSSLSDFLLRAGRIQGFNRSAFECLAKAGALDRLHPNRKELVSCAEDILTKISRSAKSSSNGQAGLFGADCDDGSGTLSLEIPACEEYTKAELLAFEKELMGLYISDHPLTDHVGTLRKRTSTTIANLSEAADGDQVTVGGVITLVKHHLTKKNKDKMAFLTLEDLTGQIKCTVFPRAFSEFEELIRRDNLVILKGKVQFADTPSDSDDKGAPELLADALEPLVGGAPGEWASDEDTASPTTILEAGECLTIRLDTRSSQQRLEHLKFIFEQHKGKSPVFFKIEDGITETATILSNITVEVSPALARKVQDLLGAESLVIA